MYPSAVVMIVSVYTMQYQIVQIHEQRRVDEQLLQVSTMVSGAQHGEVCSDGELCRSVLGQFVSSAP